MEEERDEEFQKLEEVWTTANDRNGNEMNLSSELTRTLMHCDFSIFYQHYNMCKHNPQ